MKTFEEYLQDSIAKGVIDHQIRAKATPAGRVSFYVHPVNMNADTLDFAVQNNSLFALHEERDYGIHLMSADDIDLPPREA